MAGAAVEAGAELVTAAAVGARRARYIAEPTREARLTVLCRRETVVSGRDRQHQLSEGRTGQTSAQERGRAVWRYRTNAKTRAVRGSTFRLIQGNQH